MTTTQQTAVGFLGLGEMGSALARAVIRAGHPATAAGVDAGALEAFRRYVDAAVADGHGDDEVSRVASAMARR